MSKGYDLASMKEVIVEENACTELIGWRILAILPQPNNRRPDYILGRQAREH